MCIYLEHAGDCAGKGYEIYEASHAKGSLRYTHFI